MTTNNTFNLARFGLLCRQNYIHYNKLLLTSLVGFCGALFMLLLTIHYVGRFQPVDSKGFFELFVFVFCGTGIIYAGTAFTAFRSKEKSLTYLMNPASVFEKFLMEFVSRVILFIVIVPMLYWSVYNVEANVVQLFFPAFSFDGQLSAFASQMHFDTDSFRAWRATLVGSATIMMFVIPFTGATMFSKNPLIKTLFTIAIILFFNVSLVYFFAEVLEFSMYRPSGSILFMKEEKDALVAAAIGCLVINLGLISAAYFKVKEKEV